MGDSPIRATVGLVELQAARTAVVAASALVPAPMITPLLVSVVAPVPPFATGSVPLTSVVSETVLPVVSASVPPVDLTIPAVNVAAPVPPRATPRVPLVSLSVLGLGMSEATSARNEGAEGPPVAGPAKTVLSDAVVAPVPPLATGSVPVTVEVETSTALVASFAAVIPASLTRRVSEAISMVESSTLTARSVPVRVSPAPPVSEPEPENCVNTSAVVPSVIGLSVVITQPVFPLAVPSSTNVKSPAVTSALTSASVARTAAPEDWTT